MPQTDADRWLWRADQDWLIIENSLASERKPWSLLSFHSQQAAEKCLKGLPAFQNKFPSRTHDLNELLLLVHNPALDFLKEDCDFLTQFAVDSRYREFEDEFEEENALDAIEAAKRICSTIRNIIPTNNL